jgi:hypothetical protein
MASRVQSYICFLIDHYTARQCALAVESAKTYSPEDLALRDIDDAHSSSSSSSSSSAWADSILSALYGGQEKIKLILNERFHPMIDAWNAELVAENNNSANHTKTDEIIDKNTRKACALHAHILLIYRTIRLEEYDVDKALTLTSSFLFLSTRHTWSLNTESSFDGIPEHEVYETLMKQQKNLILWLREQEQSTLNHVMEASIGITIGTESRKQSSNMTASADSTLHSWAFIKGDRSIGRFTINPFRSNHQSSSPLNRVVEVDSLAQELGIEVDLQTVQLTFKAAHLSALSTDIAADLDVQQVI